jgi:hypothetical protein
MSYYTIFDISYLVVTVESREVTNKVINVFLGLFSVNTRADLQQTIV